MRKFSRGIIILVLVFISSLVLAVQDKKKKEELFKNVDLFSSALSIISTDYVEETNFKDLIYGALKGMVSSLDPHSQFLTPEDYNELKVETEGKFGGIGVEITIKDGLLTVISPIEDTPAWKIGVKSGDRIVKINNELTRNMSLSDAVKRLRGKPGEPVNITVLRESENRLIEFKIIRDIINITNIKEAKILEDNIGYIRLVEFRENTPAELEKSLQSLKKQNLKGLILDLRNNPGGLLDIAVKVAEKFLEKGALIVFTKGRKKEQNLEFRAKEQNPLLGIPMVILINSGSASASEIVAGALQDNKRAIILGTKSFGKGSVQTVIPLSDGSALRLTTSNYFTPSGKKIHNEGIIPDIIVEEAKIEFKPKSEQEEKTKEIFRKLEEKQEAEKKEEIPEYRSDNQLMRALDILKAINFYRSTKE